MLAHLATTQHMLVTRSWLFIGLKEGFCGDMYSKKGLGVIWAKVKETVVSAIRMHNGRVYNAFL